MEQFDAPLKLDRTDSQDDQRQCRGGHQAGEPIAIFIDIGQTASPKIWNEFKPGDGRQQQFRGYPRLGSFGYRRMAWTL